MLPGNLEDYLCFAQQKGSFYQNIMTDILKNPYSYNKMVSKGISVLELISELGILSDRDIAERLNYNLVTVRHILKRRVSGFIECATRQLQCLAPLHRESVVLVSVFCLNLTSDETLYL